jgi:hypothetical protein
LSSSTDHFAGKLIQVFILSLDVFKVFQDRKGEFACSAIPTEGDIKGVLNLLRASYIAFPGEKVMEKAQTFAATYLKEALQKIQVSSLSREVRQL